MPPKVNTAKTDIVNTAVEIVRQNGADALNARAIAARLGCSTQPIFSNFTNMDELRLAVVEKADALCQDYIHREIESERYPVYKATGMAYIRFAKEEKELFRLLYMRDRSGETAPSELAFTEEIESMVRQTTGLDLESAKLFHMEMWACVHGIATMFATGFVDLPWELVSKMQTDLFQGLRKQYEME